MQGSLWFKKKIKVVQILFDKEKIFFRTQRDGGGGGQQLVGILVARRGHCLDQKLSLCRVTDQFRVRARFLIRPHISRPVSIAGWIKACVA